MSIAALLARAKTELAAVDAFAAGDVVESDGVLGRVAFVEDGWVHWVGEDGATRATRPQFLRKRT